jgi:endoglycosylceramidase
MCQNYNITVLLDSHQDLFSKKFCGEGFPDWAVKHNKTFPFPLPIKLRRDAQGFPITEDCLKQPFALFYLSYDVMRLQQDFFTNADGLADQFGKMWIEVAKVTSDLPNLIGYEIINEPSGANVYDYPYNFLWPGVSNNKFLLPFYKKMNKAIRSIDKDRLLFFEPSIFDVFAGGFDETPGGIFQLEKQVLSYHLYCPIVTSQGQPVYPSFCQKFDELTLQSKFDNYKRLGVGGFLTEFGALSDSTGSADEVLRITKFAEDNFQSWIYWQFKYYNDVTTAAKPATTESFYFENGTLQQHKVRALSHPYAYAICGEPVSSSFTNSSFILTYLLNYCGDSIYSEIYINEPLYYEKGFGVIFEPSCNECHLEQISLSYYKVVVPQRLKGK